MSHSLFRSQARPLRTKHLSLFLHHVKVRCGLRNNKVPRQETETYTDLKLEIEAITWCRVSTAESVARAIQYFIERGCELGTFELILNQLWDRLGGYYEDRHHLLREIAASQEVMAALVELEVSKTLTVSVWFRQEDEASEHELRKSSVDKLQDFVDRLASEKGMTATGIVIEDTKGDGAEDDSEGHYNGDDDWGFIPYKLSWCLRSQCSEPSSRAPKWPVQAVEATGGTF